MRDHPVITATPDRTPQDAFRADCVDDLADVLTSILGATALLLDDLPPDHILRSDVTALQLLTQRAAHFTRQRAATRQRVKPDDAGATPGSGKPRPLLALVRDRNSTDGLSAAQ